MTPPLPRLLVSAATIATLLGPAAARADSQCTSDAARLCPDVPIGEGRILTCLQARWSEVSGSCQHEIQAIQNRAQQISSACAQDVWQYCRNVAPGAGRLRVCLRARWNDLSSTCRDEAARVAEKAQQLWKDCSADAERLCPDLKPGGGQIFLCLKAQESKTSNRCQAALR